MFPAKRFAFTACYITALKMLIGLEGTHAFIT